MVQIWAQVWVSDAWFLIQSSAYVPEKAEDGGSGIWAPATHVGDLDLATASGSSLLDPGLASVAMWKVNDGMEDTCLFLFL